MWCLISWHFFHFICHYGFVEDVWCLSTSLHDFSFLSQHLQMVYSYHEITKYTYRLHDVNPTYTMLQRPRKNSAYSFLTPAANTLWILEWHLKQLSIFQPFKHRHTDILQNSWFWHNSSLHICFKVCSINTYILLVIYQVNSLHFDSIIFLVT